MHRATLRFIVDRDSLPTFHMLTAVNVSISDADPKTAACRNVLQEYLQPLAIFYSL